MAKKKSVFDKFMSGFKPVAVRAGGTQADKANDPGFVGSKMPPKKKPKKN